MAMHSAVAAVGPRKRLELIEVPTVTPKDREVRVHVEWTASTPLDMHQAEGGLVVQHWPHILGDGFAGTVVEVGPDATKIAVGDKVFGFAWKEQKQRAHQDYVTVPEYLMGKLFPGCSMKAAVTLPNNFVTVFHAVTHDLGLPLPWPRPAPATPDNRDDAILIWGASSSVGMFALQILCNYGYRNLLATASSKHHSFLKSTGATEVHDYKDKNVISSILKSAPNAERGSRNVPFILDCIGSLEGSIRPISKIAKPGSKVAVLLPVIIKDATDDEAPEYGMDVEKCVDWAEGVETLGVRTHFYLQNEFFKEHLQLDIMPKLLAEGVVQPNKQKIIEGDSMLERGQKAVDALRRKEASGERLVWRVSDNV